MITNPYDMAPWPMASVLKRPSPGIAVIGRAWVNIRPDRLPYLIGNILHDLADEYPIVLATVNYAVSDMGQLVCSVRLIRFVMKLMPLNSVEWQNMGHFTRCFLSAYADRDVYPTQYIECDRSGLYAVSLLPPKSS